MGYCAKGSNCYYLVGMNVCSDNCILCTSNALCQVCESGYYLQKTTSSSYCVQCSGACPYCPGGEYWDSGLIKCSPCDPTCLTCTGSLSNQCTQCSSKMDTLSNGKCDGCSTAVFNCKICDNSVNPVVCSQCQDGFYKSVDGKCSKCDLTCKNY